MKPSARRPWAARGMAVRVLAAAVLLIAARGRAEGPTTAPTPTTGPAELSHRADVTCLAFSEDGKTLFSAGFDQRVKMWTVPEGKPAGSLPAHPDAVMAVGVDPNGRWILTACGVAVRKFDATAKLKYAGGFKAHKNIVNLLAWSPDGAQVASAGHFDQEIRLWKTNPFTSSREFPAGSRAMAMAYGPEGRWLATAGEDGKVRLWDLTDDKHRTPAVELHAHVGPARGVALLPDGAVVTCGDDTTVRIYDRRTQTELIRLKDHTSPVEKLAVTEDGQWMLTGTAAGGPDKPCTVVLWELALAKPVASFQVHERAVSALAFAPDGSSFATGDKTGKAMLWGDPDNWPGQDPLTTPTTQQELSDLWVQLGKFDAQAGWRAMAAMARGGDGAVAFLATRISPAKAPADLKDIELIVADLDSANESTVNAAADRLAELGPAAAVEIEKAIKEEGYEKHRIRMAKVLSGLSTPVVEDQGQLRAGRVVAVLERIGTDKAKSLLVKLAGGSGAVRQTRLAKAALRRMGAAK